MRQGGYYSSVTHPEFASVEQIKRYIALAKDSRQQAELSRGETRAAFVLMAEQWEKLAACSADLVRQELNSSKDR
jgi:hypothetical protein